MQFNVKLDNTIVKRVSSVKYLGIVLDQFMDFSSHVDKLVKKASSKLKFLYRNACCMNQCVRKLLCQSLIFSILFNFFNIAPLLGTLALQRFFVRI